MIYRLYTDGLPNKKVIAHMVIDINRHTWSSACICADDAAAKQMMDKMVAKWCREELERFANQRQKALMLTNCYTHLEHRAYAQIKEIIKSQSAYGTFSKIINAESAIRLLGPHIESTHGYWLPIVEEIINYGKFHLSNIQKSA